MIPTMHTRLLHHNFEILCTLWTLNDGLTYEGCFCRVTFLQAHVTWNRLSAWFNEFKKKIEDVCDFEIGVTKKSTPCKDIPLDKVAMRCVLLFLLKISLWSVGERWKKFNTGQVFWRRHSQPSVCVLGWRETQGVWAKSNDAAQEAKLDRQRR